MSEAIHLHPLYSFMVHTRNCTTDYCHYKHSIFNLNIRHEQFSKLYLKNRSCFIIVHKVKHVVYKPFPGN